MSQKSVVDWATSELETFAEDKDDWLTMGDEEFIDTCKEIAKEKARNAVVIIGVTILAIVGSIGYNVIKRKFIEPKKKEIKVTPKEENEVKSTIAATESLEETTVEKALAAALEAVAAAEALIHNTEEDLSDYTEYKRMEESFNKMVVEAEEERTRKLGNFEERLKRKREQKKDKK